MKKILIISFSSLIALCIFVYFIWRHSENKRFDSKYDIVSIIQTGIEKEALKTTYLAELMDLSIDKKQNLYLFDKKQAEKKLLSSPLIKSAKVKKIKPSTIYIDYQVRQPVAWLYDYENTAVDEEGYIFPIVPFFSPKDLPEVLLSLPAFNEKEDLEKREGGSWSKPLSCKHIKLALEIIDHFSSIKDKSTLKLCRIDVSNTYFPSYGKKEIVLIIEDHVVVTDKKRDILCIFPKYLRLGTKNYKQQLANYLVLRGKMLNDYKNQIQINENTPLILRFKTKMIDMRIDKLAFIELNTK